jgi:glycosyltransferase 2 family protein
LGLGLPLLMLGVAWQGVDLAGGVRRLVAAGPLALVALLPTGVMLALDALGWWLLMNPASRARLPFGRVFAARLAGEAVGQSLPSAGLAAEAASAWYLSQRTRLSRGESIGSLAARRVLLASAHAAVLGLAALAAAAQPLVPRWLVAVLAAASGVLALASVLGARLLVRGAPFVQVRGLLRRVPWAGLRSWADAGTSGRSSLRLAAREAARPFVEGATPWLAGVCFALVFFIESLETLALLWLVGAHVGLAQVIAMEPLVSLLRALAFFTPAGLGVQELGYVALLHQLGVAQAAAVAAAFVLLKRTKEAAWTALGWCLLLAAEAKPAAVATEDAIEPGTAESPVHLRVAQPDDADAPDRARVA